MLENVLYEVSARTLENLGMLFLLEPEEAPSPDPAARQRRACVAFSGPSCGRLTVQADEALLGQLSRNMLGLADDQAPSPAETDDALRELSNVLCGNLLPAVAGAAPVFRIGTPQTDAPDRPAGADAPPTSQVELTTDAGRLTVCVFAEQFSGC